MKLPLLFNPRSGPGGKDPDSLMRGLPPEVRERIEPAPFGPPWDFAPATAQAQAAGGPLFVWGGDGTIHHAGRALAAAGCPVPLAAVPGGSGNGLVRGLRTPLSPAGALQNLLLGREVRIDLPRIDGVPFLNVCGTGFEGAIAAAFEQGPGRGLGGYVRETLRLWRRYESLGLIWEADLPEPEAPATARERLQAAWRGPVPGLPETAWSLAFANLPQWGSGVWCAPGADPTDGVLQWVRLHRPGLLDLFTQAPALAREGGRTRLREEGRLLRATVRLDRAEAWHLDGEPAPPRDRAELTLEPRAFRMQVTQACPWR